MLWFDKERFGKRPEAKAVYMKVRAGLYGYGGGVGVSLRELRGLRSDVHFGFHWPASCAFIAQLSHYTRLVTRLRTKMYIRMHARLEINKNTWSNRNGTKSMSPWVSHTAFSGWRNLNTFRSDGTHRFKVNESATLSLSNVIITYRPRHSRAPCPVTARHHDSKSSPHDGRR